LYKVLQNKRENLNCFTGEIFTMEESHKEPKDYSRIILLTLAIVGLILFWPKPMQHEQNSVTVSVGEKQFQTEVSRTSEERAKGLSFRDELCEDCAMLFVFETPGQYGFWMKDMRFPLDIFWIRDGLIVHKESNVSEKETRTLKPGVEADMVLEVNPGSAIEVGDRVELEQ
jgi:uncharacterized protein